MDAPLKMMALQSISRLIHTVNNTVNTPGTSPVNTYMCIPSKFKDDICRDYFQNVYANSPLHRQITGCPISSVTPECYAFSSVFSQEMEFPSGAVFAGYLPQDILPLCHRNQAPRTRVRSNERSDTNLGSVVNMEVAKAGRSPESLRSRAVGMVQAGIRQGGDIASVS